MALFDDILDSGNLVSGVLVGVGALVAWPLISPIARPAAKSLIKAGMIAYQQAEQLLAGALEGIGDIVAEAQQEIGATISAQNSGGGSRSRSR
jgi:hypothetical protein